jgi:hypothetical protein
MTRRFSESELRKQPKWVREHIHTLYRDIDTLTNQITQITDPEEDDKSGITWSVGIGEQRNLPKHTKVSFILSPNGNSHEGIDVSRENREGKFALRVQGDRRINVHPSAGNCISITFEE